MMGRNHLIVGTAIATGLVAWATELRDPESAVTRVLDAKTSWLIHLWPGWLGGVGAAQAPEWAAHPVSTVAELTGTWFAPVELHSVWGVVYAVTALVLFLVGNLLPDIDSKDSKLGQLFHIPGPHHGITHTDWFLAALLLVSIPGPTRVLIWLWLGALLHCLLDGLSAAGRVRFYPFARHKLISLPHGGGVCVMATGKRVVLYRVGELSEMVFLVAALSLSLASAFWVWMA